MTVRGGVGSRIIDEAGEAVVAAGNVDELEQVREELLDGF